MKPVTRSTIGAALLVILAASVFLTKVVSDRHISELRAYQLTSCERGKLDRVYNARAWTTAERIWQERSLDPKLSHVERQRAADAAVVYGESANQLRSRILECRPLVFEGREVIDDRLLREALGEL